MSLRFKLVCTSIALLSGIAPVFAQQSWSVTSPDKQLIFTVSQQADHGNRLVYRVSLDEQVVLEQAPLGVNMRGDQGNFVRGLVFQGQGFQDIDETYTAVSGKKRTHHHQARQMTLRFHNEGGASMHLIVRACHDGVAWRYHFPGSGRATIVEEASAFKLPGEAEGWLQEYMPYYEGYYPHRILKEIQDREIGFPTLVRHPGGPWLLLTEAAVYESYAGGRLQATKARPGLLKIKLPGPVSWQRPWTTPWRVAIIGKEPGTIVESTLVEDLNPACEVEATDWIQPGRATFPWWSDYQANSDPEKLKWFIDFAADMGWEWLEFDTGLVGGHVTDDWRTEEWVPGLVAYARDKGIQCYGWDSWKKLDTAEKRETVFALFKTFGIRGIKVDYLNSDSQEMFAVRDGIIRDCMKYKLMVSFHGATLPRGQNRRWPHVLTWEAVMGGEYYGPPQQRGLPAPTPAHNCTLPFTRNVVGPMDYTPVTISPRAVGRTTTDAHELALSTIFESGWQCFADTPGAYTGWAGQPYLKQVPVAWDDIHFMQGRPGHFVCLARRKGHDWFVAGINGEIARTVNLDFSFLVQGRYVTQLYHDDKGDGIAVEPFVIKTDEPLVVDMPARGGFCMRVEDAFKKE